MQSCDWEHCLADSPLKSGVSSISNLWGLRHSRHARVIPGSARPSPACSHAAHSLPGLRAARPLLSTTCKAVTGSQLTSPASAGLVDTGMAHGWLLGTGFPRALHPLLRALLPRLLVSRQQAAQTMLFASCAPADQARPSLQLGFRVQGSGPGFGV